MAGAQCCSNPPTPNPNGEAGTVEELGGLSTYISGSTNSERAVILVSDAFGYEAPNISLVADKVAAAGFYVVVPDFFYGDPFDKGFEDAKLVVEALKSKGFSAIGVAGFCWGGKFVTELSKSKAIQAAVLLHPSFVTVEDIKGVIVPIEKLGAGINDITPPAILKQYEGILATKVHEIDSYVDIFPNVAHGWRLRYNVDDEVAANSANGAHNKMLDWFSKYLK
ncbi:Dienelactone hydrolase [Parasponia andersonii]|uniref:Dienelactone hydrolase n=1 Tax=Parasponia andersonii TaxID=3476 RepID=A0A2P5B6C6_PARAD|nr:Dienelactone hydrolase [Parasponia andersonii]